MGVYYNELDEACAAWLKALMDADAIPRGDIDTRSIEDVTPNDLRGYTQCHFFAGIGGWAYALDLARWPRGRSVWTGSCPCQPFSAAGKGAGFEDERHLWPAWQHLIAQCGPPIVFGEQVASKAVDAWIDLVHSDLEGMGYAFGSVPFPAASVGAPHVRDRNYWMAYADGRNACAEREQSGGQHGQFAAHGCIGVALGDAGSEGLAQRVCDGRIQHEAMGSQSRKAAIGPGIAGSWSDAEWIQCSDDKARPVEPGTFPLAHGLPARVVRLRGYGNAIVPQQAAAFVRAFLESEGVATEASAA